MWRCSNSLLQTPLLRNIQVRPEHRYVESREDLEHNPSQCRSLPRIFQGETSGLACRCLPYGPRHLHRWACNNSPSLTTLFHCIPVQPRCHFVGNTRGRQSIHHSNRNLQSMRAVGRRPKVIHYLQRLGAASLAKCSGQRSCYKLPTRWWQRAEDDAKPLSYHSQRRLETPWVFKVG